MFLFGDGRQEFGGGKGGHIVCWGGGIWGIERKGSEGREMGCDLPMYVL